MALSEIEKVYAAAIDLIGEIGITETSDHNTKPYSTCVLHYEQARDEIIRGYAWNEATSFAFCVEDATKPKHTFTYRFTLPTDCLRPMYTSRSKLDWRVMGNYIYTDYRIEPNSYTVGTKYYTGHYITSNNITYLISKNFTASVLITDLSSYCSSLNADLGLIEIEYIKELDDPTDWSVHLKQAIILNLASKIVIPITSDQERRVGLLEELYKLVTPHAQVLDAMQGKPKQFFESEWTDSRGEI